jgi:Translation initiation factor IF-2, N-terminal region
MNPDYSNRDYSLPEGCKDLIDVIALKKLGEVEGPTPPGQPTDLLVSESILVYQLAALLGQDPPKIIADLMRIGVFAKADQPLNFEAISNVVKKYGLTAKKLPGKHQSSDGSACGPIEEHQ